MAEYGVDEKHRSMLNRRAPVDGPKIVDMCSANCFDGDGHLLALCMLIVHAHVACHPRFMTRDALFVTCTATLRGLHWMPSRQGNE